MGNKHGVRIRGKFQKSDFVRLVRLVPILSAFHLSCWVCLVSVPLSYKTLNHCLKTEEQDRGLFNKTGHKTDKTLKIGNL
jgi:hypothetical protein